MKKQYLLLILLVLLIPVVALTQDVFPIDNPLVSPTFEALLEGIVSYLPWVAMPLASLGVILGAFYFLTSGGNPEQVKKAKDILFWTFVGFAVVLLTREIIDLIQSFFVVE